MPDTVTKERSGDKVTLTCPFCEVTGPHILDRDWGEAYDGLTKVWWNGCLNCGESWRKK